MGTSVRTFYAPWPSQIWNRRHSRVHVKFRRREKGHKGPMGPPLHKAIIEPGYLWYPGLDAFPEPLVDEDWCGADVWII